MTACPKCGRKPRRTTQANKRYWALVALCVPFVFNGQRWSKLQWHALFKDMYLSPVTIKLPDGRTIVRDPESSDLDTSDFAEFQQKVEVWCNERGLFLAEEI